MRGSAAIPSARSRRSLVFAFALASVGGLLDLRGQTPTPPRTVRTPVVARSPAETDPPPASDQLAERLRRLEVVNQQLAEQLERATREHHEQMTRLGERLDDLSSDSSDGQAAGLTDSDGSGVSPTMFDQTASQQGLSPDSPVNDYTEGLFGPTADVPVFPDPNIAKPARFPLRATFGPGFQLQTEDERIRFQIHYESQIEARVWEEEDQLPANSGFFFPRQRFFFNGNLSPSVEYELAINRGVNNINVLNAYLNFHFDDRFEVRIGRFFTPFPFDQYAISNYWLLTPERSLFTTNLSLNRQIGSMAWGYLADKRLEYAAGIFNGSRNSFESVHHGVDVVGYLNARPFQQSESLAFARFLNVGSSVAFGRQDQSPVPNSFRIGGGSPDANIPGIATVPFLILNPGVVERGDRLLGSVHAGYFYNSLTVIGEWQYGYGGYANSVNPSSVKVPFSGYYVGAGYFLTGEHIERRTRVKPLYPLIPISKDDERGWGAWEIAGRVSRLGLGDEVFGGGFADPNLWSNSAVTNELGLNWYWNEYMKFYMFWLHADFGRPVQYRPGSLQDTADMLWLRCQLYF